MKQFLIYGGLTLATGVLWIGHLPSPHPINGSFIAMVASASMLYRAIALSEVRS